MVRSPACFSFAGVTLPINYQDRHSNEAERSSPNPFKTLRQDSGEQGVRDVHAVKQQHAPVGIIRKQTTFAPILIIAGAQHCLATADFHPAGQRSRRQFVFLLTWDSSGSRHAVRKVTVAALFFLGHQERQLRSQLSKAERLQEASNAAETVRNVVWISA